MNKKMVFAFLLVCLVFTTTICNAEPKTVVVGDSWALLYPKPYDKLAIGASSIKDIQTMIRRSRLPYKRYNRVIIVCGIADLMMRERVLSEDGLDPVTIPLERIQRIYPGLCSLAKTCSKKFATDEVYVYRPEDMVNALKQPQNNLSDKYHLTETGYDLLPPPVHWSDL